MAQVPTPPAGDLSTVLAAQAVTQTDLDTAESDIDDLETNASSSQAHLEIPIGDWLADGVLQVAFADGSQNGIDFVDSKVKGFRWNPVGEDTSTLQTTVKLPPDLDDSADVVLKCMVSRIGTADTTAVLEGGAFFQTVGALHDADADCGTDTEEIDEAASKTVQELSMTIAAANVPAAPCSLTLTLTPSSDLDADDLLLISTTIEYTRQQLTS